MIADLIIDTSNLVRAKAEIEQLRKGPRRGGLLLFHGAAGSGKTVVARHLADEFEFPLWRLHAADSERAMLAGLLRATCGWTCDLHRLDQLYGRLVEEVVKYEHRCILVDEADNLDQSPRFVKLQILRDLADESRATVCLFGTSALARRLQTPSPYLEQAASRVIARVEFQRPNLRDAQKLAAGLVEGIELDRDLVAACLASSRGSIRPLIEIYRRLEFDAAAAGVSGSLDLARAELLGLIAPRIAVPAASTEAETPVQPAVKSSSRAA